MTRVNRIGPQPGPQTVFSATPADIAIFGGSAGGGKTFALAYEAARYATEPGYSAAIFRRTSPELTGGGSIWEEARRIYPHLGGVAREHPALDWRFPSGALIEFRHAQYEHSVFSYQSKQWDFLGLDELSHFTAQQFWYLISRLRSGRSGMRVRRRVRASTNPDPDSFVRQLVDWWIGEDGLARDDRSGVIRWFCRLDERLVWGSSPDEVVAHDPRRIRPRGGASLGRDDVRPEPMSLTFIRARVADNRVLMDADPGYVARLNLIPGAQARRLRDGDWNARDAVGDYFDRAWCRVIDRIDPRNVVRRVRAWDKAATSASTANPDPDWTRGIRVAQLDDGTYAVDDLVSLRAGPIDVDRLMRHTAEMDGLEVEQVAWQDPGQAGVVDREHMRSNLLGYSFDTIVAREDKRVYAKVWAPLAKAGRLAFVRAEYLPELYHELEGFPLRKHDDAVDALSLAFQRLTRGAFRVDYDRAPDLRHAAPRGEDDGWGDEGDDEDDDVMPRVERRRMRGF